MGDFENSSFIFKSFIEGEINLIKEKVFPKFNPIYIYYTEGIQSEYKKIFKKLAYNFNLEDDGFEFIYELCNPAQQIDRELSPCFYIYNSTSKDRLEGFSSEFLQTLISCTKGNVIMVCVVKVNSPKTVKSNFFSSELEQLGVFSGFNVLDIKEKRELMVPRIIMDMNGDSVTECDQNKQNFKVLEGVLEKVLKFPTSQ